MNWALKMFRRHGIKIAVFAFLFFTWLFCLPNILFKDDLSTVVKSREGHLLSARIAEDGQWRFPPLDTVPTKFEKCILLFEDEYFYKHPGFNPGSIFKALWHNITQDSRRGGSTLTQQVIRLSRKNKSRSYQEKMWELLLATRLESKFTKKEILNFYATYAPFGGNVVGLETAAWRYFGVSAHELSWGQTAALAVLPNAPALIYPGTHDRLLKDKRNRLLQKLKDKGVIDNTTYALSIEEPLPKKPLELPNDAPHLTEWLREQHNGQVWNTSLPTSIQKTCKQIALNHHLSLKQNQINNLAILVLDVKTKKVLAYVGNAPTTEEHSPYIDMIQSPRSTGSILKPLLYAAALDEGLILPNTLLKDVPTVINGYHPENFDETYAGAVPASVALTQSLNIPAVRLLREYGLQKFHRNLKEVGLHSIDKSAAHYGLPLILGGAESSLWEITNAYANMAATVNHFSESSGGYYEKEHQNAALKSATESDIGNLKKEPSIWSAGALFQALDVMKKVNRPSGQENWTFFSEAQPLAWKTGTSFGFKDAWAVGTTPEYTIGVWVGNADGEGRPGLTGIQAAAPILFDVLEAMPFTEWFAIPFDDLTEVTVCKKSGHLAGIHCQDTEQQNIVSRGTHTKTCPYHTTITLDLSERYRANADCYPIGQLKSASWFTLPAVMEYYYSKTNHEYTPLPPFLPGCRAPLTPVMQFIHPKKGETLLIPREFDQNLGEVVFTLAHTQPEKEVYWYMDHKFIGLTKEFHELAIAPEPGTFTLSVMDSDGNRLALPIEIRYASENPY
jgi:penicillin-binding protein 1C